MHTTPANEVDLTEAERGEWNTHLQPALDYYAANIGTLTVSVKANIDSWVRQLDRDCVAKAMQITAAHGKEWAYTDAILKNWLADGVRSYADLTAQQVGLSANGD
nr:DnaD domain protein [Lacticaseibacillus daqingensis]